MLTYPTSSGGSDLERFFPGDSEMAGRMRALDWSLTDFGPPENWPENLRVAVSICLPCRFPILLWWGPNFNILYNDAYLPWLTEAKHPRALGRPGIECWSEIWNVIGPMMESVLATGKATWSENMELYFARRLPKEEVYITYTYAPILADDGQTVDAIFNPCTETTEQVVGARRLETLRKLGIRSRETRTVEAACQQAAVVLSENPRDLPFAAIYLVDATGTEATISAAVIPDGDDLLPRSVSLFAGDSLCPWPLGFALRTKRSVEIGDLGSLGVRIPGKPWPELVSKAMVLPIYGGRDTLACLFVAGVGPRRPWDAAYSTFFELVGGHIGSAISDAKAYEDERRRAEALADIDRAKTTFFSNVSHEFRTPITLMMGPIEEILARSETKVAPQDRALLTVAHRNSLRLLRLVNTLLDFSRVEAGRAQASYEPVDLAMLTTDLASNFRAACERAALALMVRCPSLGQPVYVDREMWEKIVLNLISNAFKFTLEGRIDVAVRADGPHVMLVVADTGIGIPESDLPHIFERFHRVEGQCGRTLEGTGIGLALVQELVRLHHGEILVQSEVGKGTTFVVKVLFGRDHLPPDRVQAERSLTSTAMGAHAFVEEALRWLPSAPDTSESMVDDLEPQEAAVRMDGERARVLIVDDNADMREYLSHLLAKWWDLEAMSDGLAALDAVRRSKPDLIVADIMMPRLDGIGLLSALRSDPSLLDIPVILLSARAGEEARIEALRVGADDYVVKPFSARELIAKIRSSLALARLRANELASMTRLHELGMRLAATPDLSSTLQEVLDATMELQGAEFGDVQLYDQTSGRLEIVAHRGLNQEFLDHFRTVDASDTSACGLALQTGTRIIIEDVNTDPGYASQRAIAASTGYRGVQSTPLFDRTTSKPVGMLSTLFREPHRPSVRVLRMTDLYARQAADVIAFRIAEQRLRESEARLSAILNQVPGAVGLLDNEGKLLLRGGPLGGLLDEVVPSRDPSSIQRWRSFEADGQPLPMSQYPVARALRGETVSPGIDFIHAADNGYEMWIRVSAAPFRNDAGEIHGAVAIFENVDNDKRAEQRLRESEARLQAAVDLVKLGCYSWDPQTNELRWDSTMKAMRGLAPDAPVDYDVWRAGVHPDDLTRVEAAIQRCADPQGDGLYDIEYRVIGKMDGVERWIATRGQTNFEKDKPVSFYGVAIDITGRKRIERTLESRVEERTRELALVNRQLRSQIEQREIAEADLRQMQRLDAIGHITSGVAHDFNNLLSIVLTNARLLSHKVRDQDDQEGLELIRTAAERGAHLTAQLLAFSRKQRLESRVVELNSKIMGMADLLSATLGGTVHLKTMLAPHLWPALADPTQIESIVLNLAINARDAMKAGGTLTLETFNAVVESEPSRPEEPFPGNYVGLAVKDTGIGIPDNVLPRVFEPFFTTKEPGKGSGLGLAQVFGFAKQSGGGVRIETRLGEGTSVKVFLPRAEVNAVEREKEPALVTMDPHTKQKSNILVVDDDTSVLRSTIRMLRFLGFAAAPADSAKEALRMIASEPGIDLVLADVAMPGMTGVELAGAIHETRPTLPVILVTGYRDLDALKEFGESHILQKPYTESELADKITAALTLKA